MTKEQLLKFAEGLADGERVCGALYSKFDVDWDRGSGGEPDFTDEQWAKFCYWFDKYQDCGSDFDEAMFFATKLGDDE
jgi:hypothetical protein